MSSKEHIVYKWTINSELDSELSISEDIEWALDTHYFDMFMSLRDKYQNTAVSLPQYAISLDTDKDVDITIKENFMKITENVRTFS